MESKINFGERLKSLRNKANLTQTELANKSELARSAIAKIEGGVHVPSWDTVLKLADALGVTCQEFKEAEPEPNPSNNREKIRELPKGKRAGVGVIRANEAINSLSRILKSDPSRADAFKIVLDWIKAKKTTPPDAMPDDASGIIKAKEAIHSLSRIPKNDRLRDRAIEIVTDWINSNKS